MSGTTPDTSATTPDTSAAAPDTSAATPDTAATTPDTSAGGVQQAPEDLGAASARLLLEAGAIAFSREHPFILAAGWASPVYVDCRRLIGEPLLRRAMTDLAVAKLWREFGLVPPFDAIAGAETAGIPWACWLADRLDLKLRYVRKRALGIGQNAQVEGGSVEGMRVLLVDDLTTDGGSKVAFVRGLRSAGATVTEALCLFNHGTFPGGAERLAGLGLRLHALTTWADVLRAGRDDLLSAGDHAELERFIADPVAWSAMHGGRTTPIKPLLL
jgi:orotate phosphoribosyltransferase